MSSERWHTHCPICGDELHVEHQNETLRYCGFCKFQWSTELTEEMLLKLSVAHQQQEADRHNVEQANADAQLRRIPRREH